MKLYIGGFGQHKLEYVRKHEWIEGKTSPDQWNIVDGTGIFENTCGKVDVLDHAHELIRYLLEKEADVDAFMTGMWVDNPDMIMICDEVGLGVVPIEKKDRIYREKVGRICCQAAESSESVVRIICGIGQKIK